MKEKRFVRELANYVIASAENWYGDIESNRAALDNARERSEKAIELVRRSLITNMEAVSIIMEAYGYIDKRGDRNLPGAEREER